MHLYANHENVPIFEKMPRQLDDGMAPASRPSEGRVPKELTVKLITSTLCGIGLIALQACSAAPQGENEDVGSTVSALTPSSYMTIPQDWGSGFNAHVFAVNPLPVTAKTWQIVVDLKGGTITGGPWGALVNKTTGIVTFTPTGPTVAVAAGSSAELLSFNSSATVGGPRAVIKAYNFQMDVFKTCQSNSGVNPTFASLAVAMATELGRWEPDQDLVIDASNPNDKRVRLSSSAVCVKNNCANIKAILGQQSYTPDQDTFNNTNFSETMKASFDRQANLLSDLNRNHASSVPTSNYKLTLIGGPLNLGYGNCGPHYVYQVDYATGANAGMPLSATDAANLDYTLCFYGGPCSYGNNTSSNPYLGIIKTSVPGCASGKVCIAIDPTDGDVSSTSTTSAGSAPSYPKNVVYDPANSLLGTACITTKGLYGIMISKCSLMPDTCGNLYCIAQ